MARSREYMDEIALVGGCDMIHSRYQSRLTRIQTRITPPTMSFLLRPHCKRVQSFKNARHVGPLGLLLPS